MKRDQHTVLWRLTQVNNLALFALHIHRLRRDECSCLVFNYFVDEARVRIFCDDKSINHFRKTVRAALPCDMSVESNDVIHVTSIELWWADHRESLGRPVVLLRQL